MDGVWGWIRRRQLTMGLIVFFVGWFGLQLIVYYLYGETVAHWWFYLEKPPNTLSTGIIFGPISHDMNTLTHIGSNIFFLLIAGGFAEPYIAEKKLLFVVFGFGYLATYLANATAVIHQLWMVAGASGGILALWAYAGLKLRHKAYKFRTGMEFSRDGIKQFTAFFLMLGIPAFLLHEAVLTTQFHSGHVIGLLLGCMYFGYDYYFKAQ